MLSITMIELSTIIPIPNMSPDNDMMFIVIPTRYIKSNDTTKARGIVIEMSNGDLKSLRKRKITRIARIAPTMMLLLRLSIE